MRIIPVIDLRAGCAVHGRGGTRHRTRAIVSLLDAASSRPGGPLDLSEPGALLQAYLRLLRPQSLYVADLDRIEGRGNNDAAVRRLGLLAPSLRILWDGGLKSPPREAVGRGPLPTLVPVLGTETLAGPADLAFTDPGGGRPPVLSLDLSEDGVVARAPAVAALGEMGILRTAARRGARTAILLFLRRVGTSRGLPRDRLERLREAAPDLELLVGGGIAGLAELLFLRRTGFAGALLATALHEGRITPGELESEGFLSG